MSPRMGTGTFAILRSFFFKPANGNGNGNGHAGNGHGNGNGKP
jgi:hypothetical protein